MKMTKKEIESIKSEGGKKEKFMIIDKKELDKLEKLKTIKKNKNTNLKKDLIDLGFLDYDNLSEQEKKLFDELENIKKDSDFYE